MPAPALLIRRATSIHPNDNGDTMPSKPSAYSALSAGGIRGFHPILARTLSIHAPITSTAYDCVTLRE